MSSARDLTVSGQLAWLAYVRWPRVACPIWWARGRWLLALCLRLARRSLLLPRRLGCPSLHPRVLTSRSPGHSHRSSALHGSSNSLCLVCWPRPGLAPGLRLFLSVLRLSFSSTASLDLFDLFNIFLDVLGFILGRRHTRNPSPTARCAHASCSGLSRLAPRRQNFDFAVFVAAGFASGGHTGMGKWVPHPVSTNFFVLVLAHGRNGTPFAWR